MSHASRAICLAVAIPAALFACRASKEPAAASSVTAAATTVDAGQPGASAQRERLTRCPSSVDGAATLVREVPGGVELLITGSGNAVTDIRTRAAFLATASDETRGTHRGTGAGLGQFGRCPVVMRNTKLDAREIPGGVAIVLRPGRQVELEWLRREVEARAAQLAAPEPFGEGLMRSCPSAVPNAVTQVEDAPYGVDVKVTEATEGGVRDVRARARVLAAQGPPPSSAPPARCPVTIPDARLHVTEVPGGATIAVKAKRGEDVEALRHDVRERARAFEPATP